MALFSWMSLSEKMRQFAFWLMANFLLFTLHFSQMDAPHMKAARIKFVISIKSFLWHSEMPTISLNVNILQRCLPARSTKTPTHTHNHRHTHPHTHCWNFVIPLVYLKAIKLSGKTFWSSSSWSAPPLSIFWDTFTNKHKQSIWRHIRFIYHLKHINFHTSDVYFLRQAEIYLLGAGGPQQFLNFNETSSWTEAKCCWYCSCEWWALVLWLDSWTSFYFLFIFNWR